MTTMNIFRKPEIARFVDIQIQRFKAPRTFDKYTDHPNVPLTLLG